MGDHLQEDEVKRKIKIVSDYIHMKWDIMRKNEKIFDLDFQKFIDFIDTLTKA